MSNDNAYLDGMKMAVKRLDTLTRIEEYAEGCPTCHRPFSRSRSDHQGLEQEAARELKDASKKCKRVLEYLVYQRHLSLTRSHRESYVGQEGFCSGEQLREALGSGDWQRRVRELSERYQIPIERKMDYTPTGGRKVAYYRIAEGWDYEGDAEYV
jgi:hypothetical protein